jgi:putative pyruvate formate lyase activating enzyme
VVTTDTLFHRFQQQRSGQALSGADRCRRVPVSNKDIDLKNTLEHLLSRHEEALESWSEVTLRSPLQDPNLLDLKAALAARLLSPCRQCWLECDVDRMAGELGLCQLSKDMHCYNEFIHYGEEREIIPTHAIFLSGCNFRCRFCSDWDHVVKPRQDPAISPDQLALRIEKRHAQGAQTLSFIGGLPDVNLAGILSTLTKLDHTAPLVWNSNMTGSSWSEAVLQGLVDVYVADWKFGNDDCAEYLAGVKNHQQLVVPRIMSASSRVYTIVRHLVMPGHLDCCTRPVLREIARTGRGLRVNLMDQYQSTEVTRAMSESPLSTSITGELIKEARDLALGFGLCLESPEESPRERITPVQEGLWEIEKLDSKLTIKPDGQLVIENLSGDMLDLARILAPDDENLRQRARLQAKSISGDSSPEGQCR